jgi:hypothetical protein
MPAPTTTTTTTTTTTIAPGPWICTPLASGPLANNCYCVTISGLLPSTCYEYLSVFTVNGTCYSGKTSLFGATQPLATSCPVVTTGIAPHPALTDGYMTCCHTVDSNGNLTIQEYGILYTENPSYNGDTTLVCTNLPTNVKKASTCASISLATPYSAMTTGLSPDTLTYYRAFAVNAVGVGYGCIYSKITGSLPNNYVDVAIMWDDPSESGSDDGLGGIYRLFCCDGTLVESCTISSFAKGSTANWSVPTGCYYVDFTGVIAFINYSSIDYDFMWSDCTHTGESSKCTYCFTGDNSISAELPTPPF